MSERRFDEKQVALILQRATEAAAAEGERDDAKKSGLTLADLKEIGAGAGIEPSRIEEAVRALARPTASASAGSAPGFSLTVQMEEVVPVPIDEERLPHLLDIIRSELTRQGIVEEVLGGFEWKARSAMGGRYVSIRMEEGNSTRIRVFGNFRDGLLTFALGPGPILGILGGLGAAGLSGGNPILIGLAALLSWSTSLIPWRYFFRREKRSLERVLNAIRETIDNR